MFAVGCVVILLDGRPAVDAGIGQFLGAVALLALDAHCPSVGHGVGSITHRHIVAVGILEAGVGQQAGDIVARFDAAANQCLGHEGFYLLNGCSYVSSSECGVVRLVVSPCRVVERLQLRTCFGGSGLCIGQCLFCTGQNGSQSCILRDAHGSLLQ